MSLETFRAETRSWLEANCPASMRTPMAADEYPGGGRRAQYKTLKPKIGWPRVRAGGLPPQPGQPNTAAGA